MSIKISNVDIFGWNAAIRGMRNAMNSWDKSDSYWTHIENPKTLATAPYQFFLGDNDHDLMMRLAQAGSDHAKFRRMIKVQMDILAPLYWWKEFDTYKVGTVANSTSTMHKIHAKEFTEEDFSMEHLLTFSDFDIPEEVRPYALEDGSEYIKSNPILKVFSRGNNNYFLSPSGIMGHLVDMLNKCRELFLETHDKKYWWQMIQLLPSSYNQLRTVDLNYEVLHNIYHARKNHKLDEWHTFCEWIENLPYSEIITCEKEG